MRILVLGGAGAMAQVTLRDLLDNPKVERIGVGDLNGEMVKATVKNLGNDRAVPLLIDARDRPRLKKTMKDWDVVINETWYSLNLQVMRSAIDAGIHYVDLGGLYHTTLKQLALDKRAKDRNVTCVLGIGSSPGVMNVMGAYAASKLDRVESVKLRSGAGSGQMKREEFYPPFSIRTIIDEFTLPAIIFSSGRIVEVPALSGKESFVLPEPVGRVEGYYTLHSELATMPFTLGKGIMSMDYIVAHPPEFARSLTLLVRLGLTGKKPVEIQGRKIAPYEVLIRAIDSLPKPSRPEDTVDIERVQAFGVKDGKETIITVDAVSLPNKRWNTGGGTVGTGIPPSITAQWLASGRLEKRGALPPESCVEPLPFFGELGARDRGITIIDQHERPQLQSD